MGDLDVETPKNFCDSTNFRLSDGIPVSAILGNLIMEHVEEKTLSSAPNPP